MRSEPPPRMKPSQRERHRYLFLRVHAATRLPRADLVRRLRALWAEAGIPEGDHPWLTRFDGVHAILRCRRGAEPGVRRLLAERAGRQHGFWVESLDASGTIAALERRQGRLRADA